MNKLIFFIVASAMALLFPSCQTTVKKEYTNVAAHKESSIKRGEYLVNIMDCHSCHTPKIMTPQGPVPDPDRLLSGYNANIPLPKPDANQSKWILFGPDITAAVGPWGTSYAANLTSDATGIGDWRFEQFKKAMTQGKFRGVDGTRPLMPPMPWQAYQSLKEEDLRAIFDYLKSTKPVANIVPPYQAPAVQ